MESEKVMEKIDWDAMFVNVKIEEEDIPALPTCKDCIHYDVCQFHITEEVPNFTVMECPHGFKNKADYVQIRHGKWVLGYVEPGYCTPGGNQPWVCSECGCVQSWRLDPPTENYCSDCGAKMDLK
jgi:hypothetical protein